MRKGMADQSAGRTLADDRMMMSGALIPQHFQTDGNEYGRLNMTESEETSLSRLSRITDLLLSVPQSSRLEFSCSETSGTLFGTKILQDGLQMNLL